MRHNVKSFGEIQYTYVRLFATLRVKTEDDIRILQQDLRSLQKWSDKWLLRFHPDKCVVMRVGKSNIPKAYYKMGAADNFTLKETLTEKDLGVYFDSDLKFEKHMQEKINKANKMMGIIRKSFEYLDEESFLLLFRSMVRSHVEYANQVWCPHMKKHIDALENVQRRATKLIPGFKDLSYPDRLKKLDLPTLAYRRLRGDMIETFKIVRSNLGYDQAVVTGLLNRNFDSNTRGNVYKLEIQRAKRDIRKYSFSFRVVRPWNSLPNDVVLSPTVNTFKHRLDRHWKDQLIKFDYTEQLQVNSNLKSSYPY